MSLRKRNKTHVWLNDATRAKLEELAAELDGTMSEVIRQAIRELHCRTFVPMRKGSEHAE